MDRELLITRILEKIMMVIDVCVALCLLGTVGSLETDRITIGHFWLQMIGFAILMAICVGATKYLELKTVILEECIFASDNPDEADAKSANFFELYEIMREEIGK